jgi:hypothetical protein
MKCVGEVRFVNGTAAMARQRRHGKTRACDGIVSRTDLRIGGKVREDQ